MSIIVHTIWAGPNGGSENFAVNMANEQAIRGNNVTIINMNRRQPDEVLKAKVRNNVNYIYLGGHDLIRSLAYRIDTILGQHGKRFALFDGLLAYKMNNVIKNLKPDVIHSHLPESAFITSKALKRIVQNKIRHVFTDHGILLKSEADYESTGKYPYKGFEEKLKAAILSLDYIVTISTQQNKFWEQKQKEGYNISFSKINNGVPSHFVDRKSRKDLGFEEDDFIFAMAARGEEPSKGWELTIEAFLLNHEPKTKLLLLGDGKEILRLRMIHGKNNQIVFTGMIQNPIDYLHFANVGILLSTFGAESQPTTVIEALKCAEPIIASNVGDLKNMLTTDKGLAGILIDVKENGIDLLEAARAMKFIYKNGAEYNNFRRNATIAAEKFDLSACLERYEKEAYAFVKINNKQHKIM